jgi:hypothetical protein
VLAPTQEIEAARVLAQAKFVKFFFVVAGALGLSWIATILIRRIPGVAKIV